MFQRLSVLGLLAVVAAAGLVCAQTPPAPPPLYPPSTPIATPPPTPTAAAAPVSDLKVSLMDGSLLSGKLSISELAIETRFGTLKVPLDQIQSFMPGLKSHPSFQQNINGLINDLGADAFSDREKAQQALTKLGPDIRGELERQLKGADNEKAMRLQKIIEDFDAQGGGDDVDRSHAWVADDVIITPGFTVVGHITTPGFSIGGNYGTLQIKMEDVREARREAAEPDELRKNISIPGSAFMTRNTYTTTGIKLAKGDQVIITASGSITMQPWGSQQCSPDGASNFGSVMPAQQIYGGTLVGRVGDSGPMIKVGSKLTWTADRAGVFQLGIASQGNYSDSGYTFPGEYQIKIRVVKKQ